ncbi:MAG TPA: hypothetical protein VL463_12285 [Kofleriaceae bacterium]|nr:hypothetical protein [Kofleriaceae bacterium]
MRIGILAAVAALSACAEPPDYTLGERGRAQLALETGPERYPGDECFLSCAIDRPLLLGTRETIEIENPKGMPWLHAASSDPSVLTVEDHLETCCDHGCTVGDSYDACLAAGAADVHYQFAFEVRAVGEGSALLVLASKDDPVFDRVRLDVRAAASLQVEAHLQDDTGWWYRPVGELDLAGEHQRLRVTARDRDGGALFASEGITMSLRGDVAEFYGTEATLGSAYGEVWPMARGTDALTAQSGTAVVAVPVVSK